MIDALIAAQRDRDSVPELLRVLIEQVRLTFRQTVVSAGGEDPGPLNLPRPGDPPKPKKSLAKSLVQLAKTLGGA